MNNDFERREYLLQVLSLLSFSRKEYVCRNTSMKDQ